MIKVPYKALCENYQPTAGNTPQVSPLHKKTKSRFPSCTSEKFLKLMVY